MYDQALENERNEYTKPNQYVLKYKYNHISGNDSSSTFDFKTINVKEKYTLSTKWTNKMKYNNCNYNYNKTMKKKITTCLDVPQILTISSLLLVYETYLFEKKERQWWSEKNKLWGSKELWK